MNANEDYEKLKSKTMPELCSEIAQLEGGISRINIARLAYEEKQMEEKFKYEKEQTELQYNRNRALLKEQLEGQSELIRAQIRAQTRWMKFSIIGMLIAAIIGAVIGAILQPIVSHQLATPRGSGQEQMTLTQPQQPPFSIQGHQDRKESSSSLQPPKKDK